MNCPGLMSFLPFDLFSATLPPTSSWRGPRTRPLYGRASKQLIKSHQYQANCEPALCWNQPARAWQEGSLAASLLPSTAPEFLSTPPSVYPPTPTPAAVPITGRMRRAAPPCTWPAARVTGRSWWSWCSTATPRWTSRTTTGRRPFITPSRVTMPRCCR